MKKLLLVAAATVVLAGGAALAQMPAPVQGSGPAPGATASPAPDRDRDNQRPGERHGMEGRDMDGRGTEMGEHHMHGHGGGMMMMRMMMQNSKAARFHFRRGDNAVDIKCAADEPTRACVDAASALMDKLAAQPR